MGVREGTGGQAAWRIGPYAVEREIGKGGMGAVYLGRSVSGRPVAIKVIRAEFAQDEHYRARFRREVNAARRVGGFHTAAVVDADPDADQPWMASAFITGPTLRELVSRQGPLGPHGLRALGAGLAEALQAIHACDLVHRDLKPSNVVMAEDGPRVLDFGIAQYAPGTRLTKPGQSPGTPGFLSPEQILGGRVDGACDVFALGAVLVSAAGGSAFGKGDPLNLRYRAVHEDPDLSAVPARMRAVVQACLNKSPGRRPSPAQLLHHFASMPLDCAREDSPTRPYDVPPPAQQAPPSEADFPAPPVPAPAPAPRPAPRRAGPARAEVTFRRSAASHTLVVLRAMATSVVLIGWTVVSAATKTYEITGLLALPVTIVFLARGLGISTDRDWMKVGSAGIEHSDHPKLPWNEIRSVEVGEIPGKRGSLWLTVRPLRTHMPRRRRLFGRQRSFDPSGAASPAYVPDLLFRVDAMRATDGRATMAKAVAEFAAEHRVPMTTKGPAR